ncbi:MFS transporter [Saccharospirillum mangrovi]|uniref:MFS transporter n=1 Tax=Saccharospirillum mangrovi TaxID=2161747 RepID=UPI001E3E44E7|nr:MFS transporter [Saccharospirillum mangrovi]
MIRGYLSVFRSYWPMLLFGLLTVFIGNFGQSFFISWYGASIQQQMNLSAAAYGSAYSGATLVSGLTIMVIGGAVDRLPLRRFIALAGAGLTLAAVLMWYAHSLWSLIIALFLLRFCGQGLMPHTAMTAVGRYFSINRGKAISVAGNGVPLGEMFLPTLAVALIALVGWQQSWLIIALFIPLVFLPLVFWLLAKAGPSEADSQAPAASARPADFIDGSRRTVLADGRFWRALPLLLAPPFIVTGLFIHQGFVLHQKDWSPALFASAFVLYGAVHWAASIFVGSLVDRYSATRLFKFMGLPFVAGLALGALRDGVWVVYAMMATLGIGIAMMGTIANALWAEVYGTKHLGSIRSLFTSLSVLSTSASPVLLDAGMDVQTFLLSMAGYAAVGVVLAATAFRSPAVS